VSLKKAAAGERAATAVGGVDPAGVRSGPAALRKVRGLDEGPLVHLDGAVRGDPAHP